VLRTLLPALVGACLLAAPAAAQIVPQKSIAGVKLKMSRAQVEEVLGEPDEVTRPDSEIFGRYTDLRFGLTHVAIFEKSDQGVFAVTTTSKRQRTSRGVGIGSTQRSLQAAHPTIRCENQFGFHHCHFGRLVSGRTVTDFVFSKRGRVKRVSFGIVID
jgi:hypothetical protein